MGESCLFTVFDNITDDNFWLTNPTLHIAQKTLIQKHRVNSISHIFSHLIFM